MNTQDLQPYQEALEKELGKLTKQFQSMGRELNEKGDWIVVPEPMDKETPEFDEVADNFESFSEDIAVLSVLETRYNQVKAALERIENGTYGTCVVSNEPIEPERLKANPAATTCIAHKDHEVEEE